MSYCLVIAHRNHRRSGAAEGEAEGTFSTRTMTTTSADLGKGSSSKLEVLYSIHDYYALLWRINYVALTYGIFTFSRGRGGGGGSDWRKSKDPYGADDDDTHSSSNWEKEFEVLKVQNKPSAPKVGSFKDHQ